MRLFKKDLQCGLSTFAWTDEDMSELRRIDQFPRPNEDLAGSVDLFDAVVCEVEICSSGIAAVLSPFRFS